MGNEQSSETSTEAREGEELAAQARRAAIEADLARRKEEAKKRILAEMAEQQKAEQQKAEHAASLKNTAVNNDVSNDPNGQDPFATLMQWSHNNMLNLLAGQASANTSNKRNVEIESESEDDWNPAPVRKRAKKARQRESAPALYKATVKVLAKSGIKVTGSTADIDNDVMLRIKKCLDRANHPNTPETEAKRALHFASRLMAQFNVTRAEVLAHEPPEVQRQYSGESIVSITRTDCDKTKPVRQGAFVGEVCYAMKLFFNCSSYSTTFDRANDHSRIDFTFYGIAENTVAAAMAFEMTYNLISEWARSYKGVGGKNSYSLGVGDELSKMAEEARQAEEEEAKKLEEQEADAFKDRIRQEETQRQAQLDRLTAIPSASAAEDAPAASTLDVAAGNALKGKTIASGLSTDPIFLDSDSESDEEDEREDEHMSGEDSGFAIDRDDDEDLYVPDFKIETQDSEAGDDELNEHVDELLNGDVPVSDQSPILLDAEPHPNADSDETHHAQIQGSGLPFSNQDRQDSDKSPEREVRPEARWASHMQLVTFRKTAQSVAEEHLKKKGVKLSKRKHRESVIRDWSAYDQGAKDGRKIDVHRRAIKE